MEKTLMHTCCAPCSVSCIQQLRAEGIEPVSFWYNPNIHPFQEYKARRETLEAYAPTIGMELIVREEYGLRDFVRTVADDIEGRCRHCYRVRLEETARYAAEHGYTSFTSTLFVSPYQNHELLRQTAEELGRQYGENAALNPKNLIEAGKFQITTPEVKITVSPEYSYMVEARVIDGRKYILIPADENVEVNGITVNIPNPQTAEEI